MAINFFQNFVKKLPDPWVLYKFKLIIQNRNCHKNDDINN